MFKLLVVLLPLVFGDWIHDTQLRKTTMQSKTALTPKRYVLDLDVDAQHRWDHIVEDNKDKMGAAIAYFNNFIPKLARPLVIKIGKAFKRYFPDYGTEIEGIARASGIPVGEIVVLNMVYQLESAFNNCSDWNTTGPGCKDDLEIGFCTSIVAENGNGNILHGRNLDFSFPNNLDELIIDLDVRKNGQTLYYGTTIVGYVGLMNGMRPGAFSFSINARQRGGDITKNLMGLMFGGKTPSQLGRMALEHCDTYACAGKKLRRVRLANPVYFIVGGVNSGDGIVISRDRMSQHSWYLHDDPNPWYNLQTNYDHGKSVPDADNRRDPGNQMMQSIGQESISLDNMNTNVLLQWPVFNPHTDLTTLMSASLNLYETTVWIDDEAKLQASQRETSRRKN